MTSIFYKIPKYILSKLTPYFVHHYLEHRIDVRTGKFVRFWALFGRAGKEFSQRVGLSQVAEEYYKLYAYERGRRGGTLNCAVEELLGSRFEPRSQFVRRNLKGLTPFEVNFIKSFTDSAARLAATYVPHKTLSSMFNHLFLRVILDFTRCRIAYLRRGLTRWKEVFLHPFHLRFYKYYTTIHLKWTRWFLFRFLLRLLINLARPIWFGIPYGIFYFVFRLILPLVYDVPFLVIAVPLYFLHKPLFRALSRIRDQIEEGYFTFGRAVWWAVSWWPITFVKSLDLLGYALYLFIFRRFIPALWFVIKLFPKLLFRACLGVFVFLLAGSFVIIFYAIVFPVLFCISLLKVSLIGFPLARLCRVISANYEHSFLPVWGAYSPTKFFFVLRVIFSYTAGYCEACVEWLPAYWRGQKPSPLRTWVRKAGMFFGFAYRGPLMFLGWITYYPFFQLPLLFASWWVHPWRFDLRERMLWRLPIVTLAEFSFIRKEALLYRWWAHHDDYSRSDFFGPEMPMSYLFYFYMEVYDKFKNFGETFLEADNIGDLAFGFREAAQRTILLAKRVAGLAIFLKRFSKLVSFVIRAILAALVLTQILFHSAIGFFRILYAGLTYFSCLVLYYIFRVLNVYFVTLINLLRFRVFSLVYAVFLLPATLLFLLAEWLWLIEPVLIYIQTAPKGLLDPYTYNWLIFGFLPLVFVSIFYGKARTMLWEIFETTYIFAVCVSMYSAMYQQLYFETDRAAYSFYFQMASSKHLGGYWLQSPLFQGLPYQVLYYTHFWKMRYADEFNHVRTVHRVDIDGADFVWEYVTSLFS